MPRQVGTSPVQYGAHGPPDRAAASQTVALEERSTGLGSCGPACCAAATDENHPQVEGSGPRVRAPRRRRLPPVLRSGVSNPSSS